MNEIKVSIIVPIYNVAEYLPKCLDSLINQTLKEIEIICIDDKSTDTSVEILKDYEKKDNRIKVIYNEQNQGTGTSRNKGLEIAKGEYIGFIDSDDWVSLDYFESLYLNAKKEKAEVSATSNVVYYYDEIKQYKAITKIERKKIIKTIRDKSKALNVSLSACVRIYSNEFLQRYGIKFEKNSYGEDLNFSALSYILADKIAVSHPPVYFYRREREGSAITGLKDITFVCPFLNNIRTFYKILEDSNASLSTKKAWKPIIDKRFANGLIITYYRLKEFQRQSYIELVNNELKDFNLKKIIKKRLFIKKCIIISLVIMEVLILGISQKIKLLRLINMERALEFRRQIKIFNGEVY